MVIVFLSIICIMVLITLAEATPEELAFRHDVFRNLYFKQNEEDFVKLAKEGQAPKTLFIGCSDSRVIPELITSSKPGDLFVIRTAGNFVPTYEKQLENTGIVGTIEFGVKVLGVHDIIVCGHSQCGAIVGLYQDLSGKGLEALSEWLKYGEKAKEMSKEVPESIKFEQTEKNSIIFQLQNLMTYPFVKEKVEKDEIRLHGWYFDIGSGQISYYDLEEHRFILLK